MTWHHNSKGDEAMWKKSILSKIFMAMTPAVLITSCATTGNKNPFRREAVNLPADHRPPAHVGWSVGKAEQLRQVMVRPDPFNRRGICMVVPSQTG
jgi:hypothetical protein